MIINAVDISMQRRDRQTQLLYQDHWSKAVRL